LFGRENFNYMKKGVKALREEQLELQKDYNGKVGMFPCRAFNIGEQVVSFPHLDPRNLAQGWCSITALGQFNPDTGGHLVLWDFGLIIRFPPGSTVLIPSALVVHSNTLIQKGETRHSLVQYGAGGIFRWVDRGFMSEKEWLKNATEEELLKYKNQQQQRWEKAAEMFIKFDNLDI
jgi:hypothetical protein